MGKNPITSYIAEDEVWCDIEEYMPVMNRSSGLNGGWNVSVRLPEKPYKKWISRVTGSQTSRSKVGTMIREVVKPLLTQYGGFIKITWAEHGVSFGTDGDGCCVYVPNGQSSAYFCHHVDNHHQATVLFMCLSVFTRFLFFTLEMLESGEYSVVDWPEFEGAELHDLIRVERPV